MRPIYLLAILLSALLAASCHEKGGGSETGGDIWTLPKPLVARVEVSSGGAPLETYEFTYDEQNRLLTLVKTDNMTKDVLLDLQYTYPGENQMRISGKFFPISTNRFVTVVYDPKERTFTYNGSWTGNWTYTTTINGDGVAVSTVSRSDFASKEGYYSSHMEYGEQYTVSGGSVVESLAGTDISASSSKTTRTANTSALKTVYATGDQDDRQNFAAYLMPGTFPVWLAAGIPGNKKLIKNISGATGTIPSPETTTIEYTLNSTGDIDTAVRTVSNAGTPYLTRTYKFIYK